MVSDTTASALALSRTEKEMPPMIANLETLARLLDRAQFRDWTFRRGHLGHGFYVQVAFLAPTTPGSEPTVQTGRKWYISEHATEGEVFQTCLLAVLTALEHEARESFTVDGMAIFGPHLDIGGLLAAAGVTRYRRAMTTEDIRRHLDRTTVADFAAAGEVQS